MAQQRLSVVVLTRNEEKNIGACLDSVKWADEIIVVDDNSTDRTVEIASRYTDTIVSSSLDGDFSRQRNIGNGKATGEWILQMDADERVPADLRGRIQKHLEEDTEFSAFRFGRTNFFCGRPLKHGGDTHRPLRLFRRGKARFSGDRIHEALDVEGAIGDIDASIEHYNFPDIHHYVETQNFYSGLEARLLFEKRGLIPEKELKKEIAAGPVKLFFKIYVKRRGYRDGVYGLVFAVLSAWRRFLIYAKYWELNKESYNKGSQ